MKVFPTSPFSDTESDTNPTRDASPDPTVALHSPTTGNVPNGIPLKTALSRTSSTLSMSLAQEQEERAAAAAAAAEQQTRKRGRLHREVSMTRVFKNKGRAKAKGSGVGDTRNAGGNATVKTEAPKVDKTREDKGVTLVDETPIKPRISSTLEKTKNVVIEPLNLVTAKSEGNRKGHNDPIAPMLAEEEEEWMMDSSPAIVVFDPVIEKERQSSKSTVVKGGGGNEKERDKKGSPDPHTRSKLSRGRSRKK